VANFSANSGSCFYGSEWPVTERLGLALARCQPQEILIAFHETVDDAQPFYTALSIAMWNAAKWTVHQRLLKVDRGVTGLRIEVSRRATTQEKASAKALVGALRALGLHVGRLRTMPDHAKFMSYPPQQEQSVAIIVTIGSR
jgi:hypothetical protein